MFRRSLLAATALLAVATSAQAETMITGFGGGAFGGVTDRTRGTYGVALGFLGNGIAGFEAEFMWSPSFFGDSADDGVFTDNNVTTLMGSVLLAAPAGPVRVYGAGGAGLLKTRVQSDDQFFDVDSNDFGVNVGGGVIGYFGDNVGLRADVRYFRDLSDPEPDDEFDLAFGRVSWWRAVGGITLKF
jgi:hypothetical protein